MADCPTRESMREGMISILKRLYPHRTGYNGGHLALVRGRDPDVFMSVLTELERDGIIEYNEGGIYLPEVDPRCRIGPQRGLAGASKVRAFRRAITRRVRLLSQEHVRKLLIGGHIARRTWLRTYVGAWSQSLEGHLQYRLLKRWQRKAQHVADTSLK